MRAVPPGFPSAAWEGVALPGYRVSGKPVRAPQGRHLNSLGRQPTLLYTSLLLVFRRRAGGDDRSDVAAAETPRRYRPSERRRTSSGASLRNVEETAQDEVTEGLGRSSGPRHHPLRPSRRRSVETTQTLCDSLRRTRRRRVVSAAATSLRASRPLGGATTG
jgi:hypothetical protein